MDIQAALVRRRVAPILRLFIYHNGGAPGPSLLGTGEEESNCRQHIHSGSCTLGGG
jgi:hypothetical protein